MVPSTREGNQIATDSLKGQKAKRGWAVAAGADGNGRDRSVFTWRDCVLAEAIWEESNGRTFVRSSVGRNLGEQRDER